MLRFTHKKSTGQSETLTYYPSNLDKKYHKWNDHFIVSDASWTSVGNMQVVDEGDNLSDHLPIIFDLNALLNKLESSASTTNPSSSYKLRWEKCTDAQKSAFSFAVSETLKTKPIERQCYECPKIHCGNSTCHNSIQSEYEFLMMRTKFFRGPNPGYRRVGGQRNCRSSDNKPWRFTNYGKNYGKPRSGCLCRATASSGSIQIVPYEQLNGLPNSNNGTSFMTP
jgi:hypothetical protein